MDPATFRDRLQEIITSELPIFACKTQPRRLPIIDMAEPQNDDDADWLAEQLARASLAQSHADLTNIVALSSIIGLRKFWGDMTKEVRALEKAISSRSSKPLSTNSPYLLAVWAEVLASEDVVAISRSFPTSVQEQRRHVGLKSPPANFGAPAGTLKPTESAKVDVVSADGAVWTRVNTITTDRFLRELYELDYARPASDDDSDSDSEPEIILPPSSDASFSQDLDGPADRSLPSIRKECSIVQMGLELVQAAQLHTHSRPQVNIRFTRLLNHFESAHVIEWLDAGGDEVGFLPDSAEAVSRDDRLILQQLQRLHALGIHLDFGPAPIAPHNVAPPSLSPSPTQPLIPTQHINLDLSLLVALSSDITHAPLPTSLAEAERRFQKLSRSQRDRKKSSKPNTLQSASIAENGSGTEGQEAVEMGEHARSLVSQVMQETERSLLDEIHERCYPPEERGDQSADRLSDVPNRTTGSEAEGIGRARFYTTMEARDRFLTIVSKIGGPLEKARSRALFAIPDDDQMGSGNHGLESAISAFWAGSRFPRAYVPDLVPIHIHPEASDSVSYQPPSIDESNDLSANHARGRMDDFSTRLRATCLDLLRAEPISHTQRQRSDAIPESEAKNNHLVNPSPTATPPSSSIAATNNPDDEVHTPTQSTAVNTSFAPSSTPTSTPTSTTISTFVPAQMMKIGPSVRSAITPHTLRSLLVGVGVGTDTNTPSLPANTTSSPLTTKPTTSTMMTTLTANRSSIQTILRRVNVLFPSPIPAATSTSGTAEAEGGTRGSVNAEHGVIWIVEPRSLSEGMRADL
ncbi:hypothetical protein DL93DRAFT_2158698 [Clavulina sp. PMI_390]|nr:hypothetical protein DL93DRAFT_2158698 [Clavulina sp. PMI_390]